MGKGKAAAKIGEGQRVFAIAAAGRVLGVHETTAHRWVRDGKLQTIDTPLGRRVHIDEIRRLSGEVPEERPLRAEPAEPAE